MKAEQEANASVEQTGTGNTFSQVLALGNRLKFELNLEGTDIQQLVSIGAVHIHLNFGGRES